MDNENSKWSCKNLNTNLHGTLSSRMEASQHLIPPEIHSVYAIMYMCHVRYYIFLRDDNSGIENTSNRHSLALHNIIISTSYLFLVVLINIVL